MSWRGWLLILAALLCFPAAAATYTYRSDSFSWESTTTTINSWDGLCTSYPGDDDKVTINLTGGFVFRFAGVDYSSVRVLSNGMLQFGADTGFFRNYTNSTLPAGNASAPPSGSSGCVAGATSRVIMAYWTDLNPVRTGSGKVSWEQKGTAPNRRLVVSWNEVHHYRTGAPYSFQIILYEGGEFKFQYGNANATGSDATIGVQVDPSDFTLYSYNSGYNANGTAIRWTLASGAPARVAEYRFDEYDYSGQIGEVLDASGHVHHGVRVGDTASHAGGQVCRAIDVPRNTDDTRSGVDTLLSVPAGIGNKGTLSFWYRSGVSWNANQEAMLLDASGQADQPFYLQRDSNGRLRFRVTDSLGTALSASSPAQSFSANQWVHVAATWTLAAGSNQSTLRLYLNGSLVGTGNGSTSGSLAPSLSTLFVGDNRLSGAPSGGTNDSANGRLDELRVYNYDLGSVEIGDDMVQTHSCTPPLDHLEIRHASGSGVTCSSTSFEVRACSDAACNVPYQNGVSGSLNVTPSAAWLWPNGASFNIAAGSSSTTVVGQLPVVGSAVLGVLISTPAATNPPSCDFGSPACTFSAAAAGFVLNLANHYATAATPLTIAAVKQDDATTACVPAFADVNRTLTLSCAYLNPASGTRAASLNGVALNASNDPDAACGSANLSAGFNAAGVATLALTYTDVGSFSISASYSGSVANGDTGLTLSGSTSAIAAPSAFLVDAVAGASYVAGVGFKAQVTAVDGFGKVTPNFGREGASVALSHSRRRPAPALSNGVFSAAALVFNAGVASPEDWNWSEVGAIDVQASTSNYLGTGMDASGISGPVGGAGAFGPFRPHHFRVSVTPACGTPALFSYAGQPFSVTVGAYNGLATPGKTLNYDGSAATSPNYARLLNFSEALAINKGSISPASWPASQFSAGEANGSLVYPFNDKLTVPQTLVLRATDADLVSSSAAAALEPSMPLRSGRLLLGGAMGSAKQALRLPLRVESWSAQNGWVLSTQDSCTTLSAAQVAISGHQTLSGASGSWSHSVSVSAPIAGIGSVQLTPPNPSALGTVNVAINLGDTATDAACLSEARPGSTAGHLAWLRSRHGSAAPCNNRWTSDPSARASFGAISPESQRRVHERQVY